LGAAVSAAWAAAVLEVEDWAAGLAAMGAAVAVSAQAGVGTLVAAVRRGGGDVGKTQTTL